MNSKARNPARRTAQALAVARLGLGAVAIAGVALEFASAASQAPASAPAVTAPAPASATATITAAALRERQQRQDPALLVLDVRSAGEYAAGHVPGAVNLPYDQVAQRIGELPRDRDLVLYCRSGRRSAIAAGVLGANGFTRLALLNGDMPGWEAAGLPVERSTAEAP